MLLTALSSPRCVSISFPKRLLGFEKQLWLFLLSSDETSDLSVNVLKNTKTPDLVWISVSVHTGPHWDVFLVSEHLSVFRVCATHSLITVIMAAEVKSKVKL